LAQATRRRRETPPLAAHMQRGLREAALFVCSALAVYLLISLASYEPGDPGWSHSSATDSIHNAGGIVGAWFSDLSQHLFGVLAYLLPILVGYGGWLLYKGRGETAKPRAGHAGLVTLGLVLVFIGGCGLASMHFDESLSRATLNAGGILGGVVSTKLILPFSFAGTTLFLAVLLLTGVTLATGLSWLWLMDATGRLTLSFLAGARERLGVIYDLLVGWRHRQTRQKAVVEEKVKVEKRPTPRIEPVIKKLELSERAQREQQIPLFKAVSTELPSLGLLDEAVPSKTAPSQAGLEAMARQVELKLRDFGIEVEVTAVHPGPVITRYELQPAPGIKVSQITNLTKDLARALSVISVRVVEVIPGKSVVGLEIPNEHREIVRLSEILKSKECGEAASPLALGLGKDISGRPVVVDLAAMPHLLVAGTTGSGKSVAINAMILSLLYNASPRDVRLIMIDPKMLELSVYEGIPHLLTPVVTDMKEAANALRWCVAEMDKRYGLMAAMGVRHLTSYNRKVKEAQDKGRPIADPRVVAQEGQEVSALETLPYIVVLIDELADMMMVVGKKAEELIARLAQKARASGIHLILATQRPSVDVITGLIKSNIPTRIAFQVSSKIDSRVIIDQMGAEQLLGHGDMLYLAPGTGIPMRVHGAFVADHEVHKVVDNLKRAGQVEYLEEVLQETAAADAIGIASGAAFEGGEGEGADPLYEDAVRVVRETRRASVSGVQRRLKIGYNRAARLIEEMERAGIVGPMQSNGMRELLTAAPVEE
jgi:S-DNA-T family DNA segregation ATPase FtsK/SpoIIIE